MKYSCDLVKDLLPLYYDEACSKESKLVVEEHLDECEACRNLLGKIQDETYDNRILKEREEVISHHSRNVKKNLLTAAIILIAIPVIACFIVNIVTSHRLDWFFIVLTALMVFASLVIVPFFAERKKALWTFGCFTGSLLLLLLTCNIYSGGDWFIVAAAAVLFGLSVVFLPFLVFDLPLKGAALRNKGLIAMSADTLLLYLLIIICGVYSNYPGYWRPALLITGASAGFAWILFGVIRYLKTNGFIKAGICVITTGIFSAVIHDIITLILDGVLHFSLMDANLLLWNSDVLINANLYLLIFMTGCAAGILLLIIGFTRKRK